MKQFKILLFVLTVVVLLIGCSSQNFSNENGTSYQTKNIEKITAWETVSLEAVTPNEEVTDFASSSQHEAEDEMHIPNDAVEETIYKMLDRKTALLNEVMENKKQSKSGSLVTYKNEPYIEFITKFFALSMKIPVEVQKSLIK